MTKHLHKKKGICTTVVHSLMSLFKPPSKRSHERVHSRRSGAASSGGAAAEGEARIPESLKKQKTVRSSLPFIL